VVGEAFVYGSALIVDGEDQTVVHFDQCLFQFLRVVLLALYVLQSFDSVAAFVADGDQLINIAICIVFEAEREIPEASQDFGF
jgi:hypothetical protein